MKTALKVLFVLVLLVVLGAAGGFLWAKGKAAEVLSRTMPVHAVDFPIPFPLDSAEVAEMALSAEEADALAWERAAERGKHLVEARYFCVECHGQDFGGGVMVDDPMLGTILGPNITAGGGGRTVDYGPGDWDRIVRHGIKPDGTPSAMPAEDFQRMSDQELSDVAAYIRSRPTVDAEVPRPTLGPLGTVLIATGALPLSVDVIREHNTAHLDMPPAAEVSVEFGRQVAGACMGCHREDLAGGKIVNGEPGWPPAANLTSHADGLAGWTFEQFAAVMTTGIRPDGTEVLLPMTMVVPYSRNMTETEMRALWMYLQSVPATPTPDA